MSKKKKNGKQDPTSMVLLLTAIIELIKAIIELIIRFNE